MLELLLSRASARAYSTARNGPFSLSSRYGLCGAQDRSAQYLEAAKLATVAGFEGAGSSLPAPYSGLELPRWRTLNRSLSRLDLARSRDFVSDRGLRPRCGVSDRASDTPSKKRCSASSDVQRVPPTSMDSRTTPRQPVVVQR